MSEKPRMKIPESAKRAAKRALEIRKELPPSQRAMTPVGLARASQLIREDTISLDDAREIRAFLERHKIDKQSKEFKEKGWSSKGGQSLLGWGGLGWLPALVSFVEANRGK